MAKIWVIDDDERIRRMMTRILTDARHQVVEAQNGIDGVKKFRAEAPDIVVTDILMPEQEGIKTILEIRAAGGNTGIIAISGGSAEAGKMYLKMAGQLGADAILPKPFRPAELLQVLDDLLNRVQAQVG